MEESWAAFLTFLILFHSVYETMFEDKCVKTRGYTGLLSLGFWETMKLTEPLLIAQM